MNKKTQLKKVFKPIIKECLTEILMEEGLIRIVKEHNLREQTERPRILPETKPVVRKLQSESKENKQEVIKEFKKAMAPVIKGFDPFAGTSDIDEMEAKKQEGVDISKMFGNDTINSWNQQLELIQGKKE